MAIDPNIILACRDELEKQADVVSKLQPHQRRVVDRIQQDDQPGLVVAHGLGSGKTLTAIAAQDALGMPADVVVPAALQANYKKEIKKHTKGRVPKASVQSMQNVATKKLELKNPMAVVDEAHRMRDPSTATFQTLKKMHAKKRLLLTGSPFYNHPADIAPLIDLAANRKVLPFDKEEFTRRFISEKKIQPSLFQQAANHFRAPENRVNPGTVPTLYQKRAPELREAFSKWVDYHPGNAAAAGFPEVEHRNIKVPMTKEQLRVYDTMMDKAPPWVATKVKRGLPPDKKESQQLNSFLTAARQAANTTSPFVQDKSKVEDPKIQLAFEHLKKTLGSSEKAKAVIYSNFLQAGIDPYKARLDAEKIPYGEFTGEMSKKKRDELVRQYNSGKLRTLFLSSAGGEGLDLKGTRLMQILEPHWNEEKIKQVEGRGARFQSHADLPPEERKLLIENYLSSRPQGVGTKLGKLIFGREPDKSVDEYLTNMSENKEKLINEFRALLPKEKTKTSAKKVDKSKSQATKESLELASGVKPLLAASLAHTVPMAAVGVNIGRLLGAASDSRSEGALIGGLTFGALGQLVAYAQYKDLIPHGKRLAKEALRTASTENALREGAEKVDYKQVARAARNTIVAGSRPLVVDQLVHLMQRHQLGKESTEKVPLIAPHLAPYAAQLGVGAVSAALGTGLMDKWRRIIAVNELENVKKRMEEQEHEKLHRYRKVVSKLETKLEGDGWTAPKPENKEKYKDKKHDW